MNSTPTPYIEISGSASPIYIIDCDAVKFDRISKVLSVFLSGAVIQQCANVNWHQFTAKNKNSLLLPNRTQWAWFDKSTITKQTGVSPQIELTVNFDPNAKPPYTVTVVK